MVLAMETYNGPFPWVYRIRKSYRTVDRAVDSR